MTALIAWGEAALLASTALMLLVLAVRAPVRRWIGPRLGYALWALPAARMMLPALPVDLFGGLRMAGVGAARMSVLFMGPRVASAALDAPQLSPFGMTLATLWLAGAIALFAVHAIRHLAFCTRLRADGTELGRVGAIRIIATDVTGPLAFGVVRRCIAVPRTFARDYSAGERDLALAHEAAHHARGDLIANWASLLMLATHWCNPVAWIAIRAFRDDQEFAVDAQVLAGTGPGAAARYATILAKAAGIGAPPACSLNARANLKGRLMMIRQSPSVSRGRTLFGGGAIALVGGAALAATVATASPSAGKQAVTIGVKPDGAGGYMLIVGDTEIAPGTPLPDGSTLPADFSEAGGCDLTPAAKPFAMVIKGERGARTYTVMCASAAPAPIRATLSEGLASLNTMRASVATQPATSAFPEAERAHALGAIDRSRREVEAALAANG